MPRSQLALRTSRKHTHPQFKKPPRSTVAGEASLSSSAARPVSPRTLVGGGGGERVQAEDVHAQQARPSPRPRLRCLPACLPCHLLATPFCTGRGCCLRSLQLWGWQAPNSGPLEWDSSRSHSGRAKSAAARPAESSGGRAAPRRSRLRRSPGQVTRLSLGPAREGTCVGSPAGPGSVGKGRQRGEGRPPTQPGPGWRALAASPRSLIKLSVPLQPRAPSPAQRLSGTLGFRLGRPVSGRVSSAASSPNALLAPEEGWPRATGRSREALCEAWPLGDCFGAGVAGVPVAVSEVLSRKDRRLAAGQA